MKNIFPILLFLVASLHAQKNPLEMSAMETVRDMGLGINLGNTFESWPTWPGADFSTVDKIETGWGSPKITKPMIDGYKNAGFKTVRIPVAWSNLMEENNKGGTYTINAGYLNRVNEVVDYVLNDGMYAIVNIHWDGGWWENFPTDSVECMKKYKRIWEQVSEKFKNKSGYLIFESLNEEGKWDDVWYEWGETANNMTAKSRVYGILNTINQEFVNLVRASGGNNNKRHLLIAGYNTNIDKTIDQMFKMPTDPQNNLSVSVHYYDPFGFSHINKDGDWTPMLNTWGSQADYNELNGYMNKLKTNFVDKGIPVIVGEYGFAAETNATRNQEQVRNYTLAVAKAIYDLGMCPILWDTHNTDNISNNDYYYNRNTASFTDAALAAGFREIAGDNVVTPILPQNAKNKAEIISNANAQYYNMRGNKVSKLASGIYIEKKGNQIKKIVVK